MRRLMYLTACLQFVNPAQPETAWRSASAHCGRERQSAQSFRAMASRHRVAHRVLAGEQRGFLQFPRRTQDDGARISVVRG